MIRKKNYEELLEEEQFYLIATRTLKHTRKEMIYLRILNYRTFIFIFFILLRNERIVKQTNQQTKIFHCSLIICSLFYNKE